jgi:hypothetical protein
MALTTASFPPPPGVTPPEIADQIVSLIVSGSAFARRLTPYPATSVKVIFPVASRPGRGGSPRPSRSRR